jgi:hypothetical protein
VPSVRRYADRHRLGFVERHSQPPATEDLFQGKIDAFECPACQVRVVIPILGMYHDGFARFVAPPA